MKTKFKSWLENIFKVKILTQKEYSELTDINSQLKSDICVLIKQPDSERAAQIKISYSLSMTLDSLAFMPWGNMSEWEPLGIINHVNKFSTCAITPKCIPFNSSITKVALSAFDEIKITKEK